MLGLSGGMASLAQRSWEMPCHGEVGLHLWFFALFQFSHFYSVLESDPQFGFEEAKRKLQGMDTVCSLVLCLAL